MISVTKREAHLLRVLYPEYRVARTMKQDSKRHHYYATESYDMMRTIMDTNDAAAEIVERIERERELKRMRMERQVHSL